MKLFVPKETYPNERRVALSPDAVKKLTQLKLEVEIESGLAVDLGWRDEVYTQAGAKIASDRRVALSSADIVVRLRKPELEEINFLKQGSIYISHLDPFRNSDLIKALAQHGVTAISMEMIPRSTLAQKMDALSSQANLGGYVAVILAAERLNKIFPMMMTPAGTVSPVRVFIVGVGVAGLQAIATAKRLGARVEAFDTRPVVEEQVKSLGAKFVKIDIGETGQTTQGYAKALTPEQLTKQREGMAKVCASSDVVITTAQVFGKTAPVIITKEMVTGMKPGSVIVDMAVESGGNVEGSKLDEEAVINGVRIIGLSNLPGRVALNASQMYANNMANLIEHFWDKENGRFVIRQEDEIMKGCLLTHEGKIVNPNLVSAL